MGDKSGGPRGREYTNLVPWCMSVAVELISVEVLGGFETSSAIAENISCMDSSNKNDIGPRELVRELSFIEVLSLRVPDFTGNGSGLIRRSHSEMEIGMINVIHCYT